VSWSSYMCWVAHVEPSQAVTTVAREVSEEDTIFSVTTDTDPMMNAFGQLLEKNKILHLYCNSKGYQHRLPLSIFYAGNREASPSPKYFRRIY
jgi:hypothetical protein